MNNINDSGISCTGCQMCSSVCPYNAISIKLNNDGFYNPYVDKKLCKNCGICKRACSKYNDIIETSNNFGVYAFKHTDKKILKKVSSGGAAFALAQIAVNSGYLIAGTAYDYKSHRAKMMISDNPGDFTGSKYIQTYVDDIYIKLLNDKSKKYIVFGTPCQIYSLNKAANQKNVRDNFILVDFFCHGCPSMLLWENYINECKEKNNFKEIKSIEFRSKARAWHEFCISVNDKPQKNSAAFYDLFFSDKLLNEACYDCKIRSTLNYADIRVGDFWGDKYDSDSDGVSVLIAISDTGKKLINELPKECLIAKHSLDDVIKFQSYNTNYTPDWNLRKQLLDVLRTEDNAQKALKLYYTNMTLSGRTKRIVKKLICAMPFSVRAFLRKRIHS